MLPSINNGPRMVARILIVEDDKDTSESMARLLKIFGYEVEVAREGPEAIARAVCQRPDFILLDIGLPGVDGYQVARSLKQEVACPETVIIAVTGYGQPEDRHRSREAGIDYHLVKPVDHRDLIALLVPSAGRPPERDAPPHPEDRSADASGLVGPRRNQDATSSERPGAPSPATPPVLESVLAWRGREDAARPVLSGFTADPWDK